MKRSKSVRVSVRNSLFSLASFALSTGLALPARAQERAVAIRGGTVIPIAGPTVQNGTVVIQRGKIVAVGANVQIPSGAEIVDARGKYVMPGVVDAATNLGLEGSDQNDASDPVTPASRAFESFNPFGTFGAGKLGPLRNREVMSGGVTTMYVGPADAALVGGQGVVVKTAAPNLDALVLREPAALDMTLGTPPKTFARARNRDPYTRMAEVAMIRQLLVKGQEYDRNKKTNPNLPRDLAMEAVGKALRKEIPARIQANSPTDIRAALGLAQEFGLDLIIDGAAGALDYKEELVSRRVPIIIGLLSHPFVSNEEIPDLTDYPPVDERTADRLIKSGVKTAIASFSRAFGSLAPAGSSKWLLIDAGIAGGYGMAEDDILKAVTIVPAEILGVADRVGTLEPGKDADVIMLDGPPLSIKTWVQKVWVNGEMVYQKESVESGR